MNDEKRKIKIVDIPLTDPRVSPQMRRYLQTKGFCLKEYGGFLTVIGEEGGRPVELGYELFCTLTKSFYADELAAVGEED